MRQEAEREGRKGADLLRETKRIRAEDAWLTYG